LVTRNGRPVTDLQDYLGARGHLVALRAGDLAYLHVHPTGGSHGMAAVGVDHGPSGTDHVSRETGESIGEISFAATFPSAGRYRLFLQFKVDGKVRTVAYTVNVPR
jgi:hypothetical protein